MRSLSYSFIVLLAISLVGCQDLAVDNESNPDREAVLATPADLESVASGTFESFHRGTEGQASIGGESLISPSFSSSTLGDTHTASWGNFAMRQSANEPRVGWNNDPSFTYAGYNEQPYFQSYTTISNAIDVLAAIENIGRQTINDDIDSGTAARMEAFVSFNMGLSYMYLAARYDKGALIDETDEFQGEQFVAWPQVLDFGVSKMDRAIEVATNNEFTIPGSSAWFFGNEMTSGELAALANSMKAKYVTLAARTPSQRSSLSYLDGVDWSTVNTWLNNGMRSAPGGFASGVFGPRTIYPGNPAGFFPVATDGFPSQYDAQLQYAQSNPIGDTWARADYKSIGPANEATADGQNKYDRWKSDLADDDAVERGNVYLTDSPDARVVGPDPTCGDLIASGRAGFGEGACGGNPSTVLENAGDGKYFGFRGTAEQNEAGEYVATPIQGPFPAVRGRWHYSDRGHDRYLPWQGSGGGGILLGPMPHTLQAEMDLLKAEALIQTDGDLSTAADLIDRTRVVKGGLPSASQNAGTGTIEGTGLNPLYNGGNGPPGSNRPAATLYSMLKYEYIIETWTTSSGVEWMAKRGWGVLQEGSRLHYPVPGAELETLGEDLYTFGGEGGPCSVGNVTDCRPSFGNGGGGGANIVLDEDDSHWSTLPNTGESSSSATITLDPR